MTNRGKTDAKPENWGNHQLFESESISYLGTGLRLRPSELARLLGVSKQAVSAWIKEGKVLPGVDGRIEPRQAIRRLLVGSNPAQLRAAVLRPIAQEIDAARQRITDLENQLQNLSEDAKFHEESSLGFLEVFDAFKKQLEDAWDDLLTAPDNVGVVCILAWLDDALTYGAGNVKSLMDYLQMTSGAGAACPPPADVGGFATLTFDLGELQDDVFLEATGGDGGL